jgi:hypothetical protein
MWLLGGGKEVHIEFLWQKPDGNKPLGIHKRTSENNIKMDLQVV